MISMKVDAIIIGAGVIGAACAYELAKTGRKTLNIDMLPAAGYGSTSNSCAIIRVYYSTIDSTALAYEAFHYWQEWASYLGAKDGRGLAEFHDTGTLVMKTGSNGYMRKSCAIMDELNIPYEHWSASKISSHLHSLDLKCFAPAKLRSNPNFGQPSGGEISGGVYFPAGGYVNDPQLATRNLQNAAETCGGEFMFGRRVTEIKKSDNRISSVVLDDGQEIEADILINAAGPYSRKVNELVDAQKDMRITTRAIKQEVVHLPAPDGFELGRSGLVISDSDIACYSRPEVGNHILIGSEDPECDIGHEVDPDDWDNNFSEQWTTQAMRQAQRIPSLGITSKMRGAVDLYDVTEDWAPIYDKSSIHGYFMAIGTSGNQFKNAPVAGKIMSALISHADAKKDHDVAPAQIKLEHIGHNLDLTHFSRLRNINPDSSFSVLG